MKGPKQYHLTPAGKSALLNFPGRQWRQTMSVPEVEHTETVTANTSGNKPPATDFVNRLFHGDCLSVCAWLKDMDISIDLVYMDPPFASGGKYAKKIFLRTGAQSHSLEDNSIGEEIMYHDNWQQEEYLDWLYIRLLAIREVLSNTGSIYVHLDWHIGHYVKILLDEVFGEENFRNEIIWHYGGRGGKMTANQFPRNHDTIYRYSKNHDYIHNKTVLMEKIPIAEVSRHGILKDEQGKFFHHAPRGNYTDASIARLKKENRIYENGKGTIRIKYFHHHDEKYVYVEKIVGDVWNDIEDAMHIGKSEKTGYATQKPETLLERIIAASTTKDMVVADFFSGSGTTAKIAHKLQRRFIAADICMSAVQITRDRLGDAGAAFEIYKIRNGAAQAQQPTQELTALSDPDRADIELHRQGQQYQVKIRSFHSPCLSKKWEEYNEAKAKRQKTAGEKNNSHTVNLSKQGLELVAAVQFDTILGPVWQSNRALEDVASMCGTVRGKYILDSPHFKIKIRNIAGDEIIIHSKDLKIL